MFEMLKKGRCVWQRWRQKIAARLAEMHAGPDEGGVQRRFKRKRRRYNFRMGENAGTQWGRRCIMGVLACVMLFSLYKLGSYAGEYIAAKKVSQELRTLYYEDQPAPAETTAPVPHVTETSFPVEEIIPTPMPVSNPTPRTTLETVSYPGNSMALTSTRFTKLQRQNADIIGWLNIPNVLDEAVVQRDNSYYLRRDYRGYHNDNGAIFLDENCDLRTRPYTLMVFGHNMKSGAMFGCLRNYESVAFYRNHPFVTFDTAYEEGRYVIFAVGTLTQNRERLHYVDVGKLLSLNIADRNEAISQLRRISEMSVAIDVKAEDQLLLLITCVGDDTERRFVAARRIRPDEDESQLQKLVRQAYQR